MTQKLPPSAMPGAMPEDPADGSRVFDRDLLRRRRDRAAPGFAAHDFLKREVGARLAERLGDVKRDFPLALDLGAHDGTLAELLAGVNGIETLVHADLSPAMCRAAASRGLRAVAADEEALPFAAGRFDLAVSALSLHWVNDLPGALLQLNRVLKPDGLFLGAMIGGRSLSDLRAAFMEAEIVVTGGAAPRVAPMVEVRDAGALLQRAGFALPVADSDRLTVTWPDPLTAMRELRGMGEGNALLARHPAPLRREVLLHAASLWLDRAADADGRLAVEFEIVWLTGWHPDASQQVPLRPGSAKARLADALGTDEHPLPGQGRGLPH